MSANTPSVNFPCPACNARKYSFIKQFEDGVVVGKCSSCGLIYTPGRHQTPAGLFTDVNLKELATAYQPILDKKVRHFRTVAFEKYLAAMKRHCLGTRHLDVGCAHGFFPNISREAGNEVTGVEPSASMVAFGRQFLHLDMRQGILDDADLGAESWDMVSFTDSMEYIPNPHEGLRRLVSMHLNPGGVVFIKVPNGNYFVLRHWLKKRLGISIGGAEAFSPSRRVVHYTERTLKKLVESHGLTVVESGYFMPIDSPVVDPNTGEFTEFETAWNVNWKQKMLRKALHTLGELQTFFTGHNHLSQSVYVVAQND